VNAAGAARSDEAGLAPDKRLAERILEAAVVVAVAGVVVQTLVDVAGVWAFDREHEILLADSDDSLFAWASIVATFAAAVGALLLSLARPGRSLLWFIAVAAAFLSLDDFVRIHERLGDLADRAESLEAWEPARLLWPMLFFPLLGALFLALWRVAGRLPRRPGRFLLVGLLLLTGAVALELVSAGVLRAGYDRGTVPYELEVIAEEGAELAGWILVAGGLLAAFALDAGRDEATMRPEGG
jgi:hypothetical protein